MSLIGGRSRCNKSPGRVWHPNHLSLAPCCQLAPPRPQGNGAKDGTKDWEELPTKIAKKWNKLLEMCEYDIYIYV